LTTIKGVKSVELVSIVNYSKTRIAANELNVESYVGVDNLLQNKQGKTISNYVPKTGKLTRYEIGDILIGNIRPYLKKIWRATNVGGTNGDVLVIRINEMEKNNLSSGFLYHLLASDIFFNYNMQTAKGAKMPRGNKTAIMKYKIPVPPLSEQERIVTILDKFDALVNDISIGLPAELSARRQQYEYYRGKLLTFKHYG
jgi:type I restriction enzyme S subunit